MTKVFLNISLSLITLAATQIRADEPATQLNGTWQYVAAIESDRITTYDDSSAMQLVILDNTWALFSKGNLVQGTVENVKYNRKTSPLSFVRRAGKAPHAVGHAILKVTESHLMYTTTPLDATGFGSTSGAVGDYIPDPQSDKTEPKDPLARNSYPPKSFSPEGTSNSQYILRRISNTTSAMSQITKR